MMMQYQALIADTTKINTSIPLILNTHKVVNGIMKVELINLTLEQIENNHVDFELRCFINNEWHSILFDEYKLSLKTLSPPSIHIRFALNLNDYVIKFKIRFKLHSKRKWSKYSVENSINIPSLISSDFGLFDYVEYRQETDYYLQHGMIVKIHHENDTYSILPKKCLKQVNDGELIENVTINVHKSRLLGQQIKIYSIIDIDQFIENKQSNFLLLRSMDDNINNLFMTLIDIYSTEYAEKYSEEIGELYKDYNHYFIGRYVAKFVMEYLFDVNTMDNEYGNGRFMVNCLIDSNDGIMTMYPMREYIIKSRLDALKYNVVERDPEKLSHVDALSERCDVCNVGISSYDWILKCPQTVCDYHIVCSKCGNNVVIQFVQLMELLKDELRVYLNDDCIHEVVSFTVAPIVQLKL